MDTEEIIVVGGRMCDILLSLLRVVKARAEDELVGTRDRTATESIL